MGEGSGATAPEQRPSVHPGTLQGAPEGPWASGWAPGTMGNLCHGGISLMPLRKAPESADGNWAPGLSNA